SRRASHRVIGRAFVPGRGAALAADEDAIHGVAERGSAARICADVVALDGVTSPSGARVVKDCNAEVVAQDHVACPARCAPDTVVGYPVDEDAVVLRAEGGGPSGVRADVIALDQVAAF